ncbi:hypothetical protein BGZ94_000039 [Podila epigama]|nr:hypothetical protein BGZ94_000039 [Podila epigama]
MDHEHMGDSNPNAHPLVASHLSNPLIIIHVALMLIAYGILMPIGIMLGIRRHKYHVPWNIAMVIIALAGYFFGYFHHMFGIGENEHNETNDETADPQSSDNMSMPGMRLRKRIAGDSSAEHFGLGFMKGSAHGALGNILLLLLLIQFGMGVYRKLTKTRPRRQQLAWLSSALPRNIHSYLGKAHLLLAYIQITLGCIKLIKACPGQAFSQCISHIVMGSSFWWYGGIYIAYLVGSFPGVTRPEWYESVVMTVWGVINFSILHQWGTRWSHADLQHTSLGLLWVGGGVLSMILESKYSPLASFMIRKNPLPALLIVLTGFAMGQHSQYYAFATTIHTFFGYCLMLGGLCRLVQLALRPAVEIEEDNGEEDTGLEDEADDSAIYKRNGARPGTNRSNKAGIAHGETPVSAFFGFLSALGLISAGVLFESAHEEQLNLVMYYLSDPSTYINWIMALAFFTTVYMLMILQVGKKQRGGEMGEATLHGGARVQKSYNRLRTRDTDDDRVFSSRDIEMSGFMEE